MRTKVTVKSVMFIGLAVGAIAFAVGAGEKREPASAGDRQAILHGTGKAFTQVAKDVIPAVVFIQVEKTVEAGMQQAPGYYYNNPFDFFGDDFMRRFFHGFETPEYRPRRFRQQGQGSGFIISDDGYILTNNHVVGDADKIRVKLHDGREFDAERVGADPKSEVAVIKIEAENLPFVEMGDSEALEIGEWVVAIGNPFGLSETLTVGVVSAKGRSNIGVADYEDFIQTDAAINPGNSGGPLLNIEGRVIGINTAIYSQSGGYMGIGFAIPINMATAIKEQLVESGKVVRGYLGIHIQEFTPDLARSFGIDEAGGILISEVEPDSPADKAGLRQADIIRKLNDVPVGSVSAFRNDVSAHRPGNRMKLTISRDGKTFDQSVEAGEMPGDEATVVSESEVYDKLGFTVGDLTQEMAERFGYDLNEGVIVTQIEPEGLAARFGIRPGTLITGVNRQRVTTVDEFKKALVPSDSTGVVLLRVREGRFSRFVAIGIE